MPDRDMSRVTIEKATRMIELTRAAVKRMIPFGPDKVRMTPREARRFIQGMSPSAKDALFKKMGPDEWDKLMERIYGKEVTS